MPAAGAAAARPGARFTGRRRRRYVGGAMSAGPGYGDTLIFERILLPHRSLPPAGFRALMLALGLLSLAVGIGFVAIVYGAFRLSYRSARQRETLRLAGDAFTVERIGVRGDRQVWRFQPFWLRVILEERPDDSNRLFIASHGKSLAIGDFLAPAGRRELAATLRAALGRWREALNPANSEG